MPRLWLLVITFCIIALSLLNAQTASRIDLIESLSIPSNYDYVTTRSDSLLHFYKIENTDNTFALMHWTCSNDGFLTTPIPMFAYSSVQYWGTSFPTQRSYWKQNGFLYISFTVLNYFHLIRISEDAQITHKIIFNNSNVQYHLFTKDFLYYAKYYQLYDPISIHRYNLNTDTTDSLITIPAFSSVEFLNFDNKYLFIYKIGVNNMTTLIAYDTLHVYQDFTTNLHQYNYVLRLYLMSDEISPGVYFGYISDGLLRGSLFGYYVMSENNLTFNGLSYHDAQNPLPIAYWYDSIIPYGNGRFSCREGHLDASTNFFANYQYNNGDFIADNDFPNLQAYTYPISLRKVNDRYAIGIAGTDNNPRQFICIDYQNQSLVQSTFAFTNAPYIYNGQLLTDNNNLYYVYKTSQTSYLYTMKIVEFTDVSDPVQPPQVISADAYPNPFNQQASIKVSLKQPEAVTVSIYNTKGQLIRNLSSQVKADIAHELGWDGKADNHCSASSGLYIYRITSKTGQQFSGKLMFIK